MLKAVDTIKQGAVILVGGNRHKVARVFSNDICIDLQLHCATPNVIHTDNDELEEGAIVTTVFDRGSMIPVVSDVLQGSEFDAVLDLVALALYHPAEYKATALSMLDSVSAKESLSLDQSEEIKKVRYVLRNFVDAASSSEIARQAELNRIAALKAARDAAYKAFADHEHDMATDPAYRATAERLIGKTQ